MSRLIVAEQELDRLPTGAVPATGIILAGGLGAAIASLLERPGLVALSIVVAVVVATAIVSFTLRAKKRQESIDLYLLRMSGLLGWPSPDRSQVTGSRWKSGWIGSPTQLRLVYNPLADEVVPEMIAEARRLADKAFGTPYRVHKLRQPRSGKGTIVLRQVTNPGDIEEEVKLERVKTLIAKSFGTDARTKMKVSDGGHVNEITIQYEVTPRLASGAIRARLESSISAMLRGRWRAFWDLEHDTVRLEERPALPAVIPTPNVAPDKVDPLATYDDIRVPIGRDEDGNSITWRPKHNPHGLVTGKTGKGKTVCLLGITQYLAAHGWEIWGIDGKRIELLGLRSWPNVKLIAGRLDHQARVAHEIYTLMQKRFEDYEAGRVRLEDFTPVLLVVDEFKTFKNAISRWYRTVKPKGMTMQPPVLEEISDFVSLARKVRMHIVIGLQRPDAEFLTGDMRDNFNFRVSFGRLSPEGAKMMWDSFSTGVAVPVNARGRGIAYNDDGHPVEIQGYWTPDPYQTEPEHPELWVFESDLELVEQIRPNETLHELMRIVDPEESVDLDSGEATPLTYLDYMEASIVPAGQLPELERKAAGIFNVPEQNAAAPTSSYLDKIQREEEEPEIPDEDDLFNGYAEPDNAPAEELLDASGELAHDGTLVLIDDADNTWGLVDDAEYDFDDENAITLTYRDFESGEIGTLTVPIDDSLTIRKPESVITA